MAFEQIENLRILKEYLKVKAKKESLLKVLCGACLQQAGVSGRFRRGGRDVGGKVGGSHAEIKIIS